MDPHFLATEAMARFVTEMVVQLSSSTKIPFDARELAQSLEDEFNELRATLTLNGMKFLNKLGRYSECKLGLFMIKLFNNGRLET